MVSVAGRSSWSSMLMNREKILRVGCRRGSKGSSPAPIKIAQSEFKLRDFMHKPRGRQEKNGWIYGPAASGRPEGLYGSW